MNILVISAFGKILFSNFIARALANYANILTVGSYMTADDFAELLNVEKKHLLKKFHESKQNIKELSKEIIKSDLFFPPGKLDSEQIYKALPASYQPDLLLWVDTNSIYIGNFEFLKNAKAVKAAYIFNTHTKAETRKQRINYAKNFDIVFLTFKHDLPDFKEVCPNVYWLPFAFDPVIYKKLHLPKEYDWSFVGQTNPAHHPERVKMLRNICRNKSFKGHIATAFLERANEIFNQSHLVLNKSLNNDLNMRVFETLGSGNLLFTDRLKEDNGIYELFRAQEDLIFYQDEKDLPDLMKYYLSKPDVSQKIADNGYQKVIEAHTYKHRAKKIMEISQEYRQKQAYYLKNSDETIYLTLPPNQEILKIMETKVKGKEHLFFSTVLNLCQEVKKLKYIESNRVLTEITNMIKASPKKNICFINTKNSVTIRRTEFLNLINSNTEAEVELLKKLIAFIPDNYALFHHIGKIYQNINEYDRALQYFTLALKSGLNHLEVRDSITFCLKQLKKLP